MKCWALSLLLLVACGDNKKPARVDGNRPSDAAADTSNDNGAPCGPGGTVSLRRVAFGCGQVGAPPVPGCLDGILTLVTFAFGDDRLFVLEERGAIRIVDHERVVGAPFLDLSMDANGPVLSGGEQGLLGLAFDPDYATNGEFYVDYTAYNPDLADTSNPFVDVVSRYTVSAADPNRADPASAVIVLSIPDPYSNHNGGMLEFGADGDLYISEGDGGYGGDPHGNGQNPHALLGKILRIDVHQRALGVEYGIPADNPYADGVAGAPEVYILGLRNPWRWTFDRPTGDMWIGDVGQSLVEELDVLHAGQQAGKNLGWNMYEGDSCYTPPCDPTGKLAPTVTHTHDTGWNSIIGGQVYRGSCYPDLTGYYFYSDDGGGRLVKAQLQPDNSLVEDFAPGGFLATGPSSLHTDARGELYETDIVGNLWRLQAGP